MNNTFVWVIALIGTVTSVHYAAADTTISESIRSTFYPYRTEVALHQGITPGITVGQQNWHVAEKVLPVEIARLVQAGDLSIIVQETTDLPARQAYISATEQHANAVSLDGGYRVHTDLCLLVFSQ